MDVRFGTWRVRRLGRFRFRLGFGEGTGGRDEVQGQPQSEVRCEMAEVRMTKRKRNELEAGSAFYVDPYTGSAFDLAQQHPQLRY